MSAEARHGTCARRLRAVRSAYGMALLGVPVRSRGARWYCRALGSRQIAEALLLSATSRRAALLGAGVDVVHGATALALAGRLPSQRMALRANAVVATALALAGVAAGGGVTRA